MFESSVRLAGDLAGVFEFDGETAYFYLYDQTCGRDQMVIDHIHILSGKPDFEARDVVVRWDDAENIVALLIKGDVWAVFEPRTRRKHGGDYKLNGVSAVPVEIALRFDS
jgi:hypothetical protein